MQSGLLLVDKPEGMTSHDVVAKVRRLVGTRKVGHAGTLDPMATGLLVLGIESATRLLTFIVGADKTYEATIRLGASTVTDDRESDFLAIAPKETLESLSESQILLEVAKLTGEIKQVPSSVSAIKIDGQRAYAKVRGGEAVELASRPVTVERFELLAQPRWVEVAGNSFLEIDVVVDCSSGTYIRALARDLGAALGVGGHLSALRRTRVGGYRVSDAYRFDQDFSATTIMPNAQAAREIFPEIQLSAAEKQDLVHGKRIANRISSTESIAAFDSNDRLVAILEPVGANLKSTVVFAEAIND